jgi:hypothetical protein
MPEDVAALTEATQLATPLQPRGSISHNSKITTMQGPLDHMIDPRLRVWHPQEAGTSANAKDSELLEAANQERAPFIITHGEGSEMLEPTHQEKTPLFGVDMSDDAIDDDPSNICDELSMENIKDQTLEEAETACGETYLDGFLKQVNSTPQYLDDDDNSESADSDDESESIAESSMTSVCDNELVYTDPARRLHNIFRKPDRTFLSIKLNLIRPTFAEGLVEAVTGGQFTESTIGGRLLETFPVDHMLTYFPPSLTHPNGLFACRVCQEKFTTRD